MFPLRSQPQVDLVGVPRAKNQRQFVEFLSRFRVAIMTRSQPEARRENPVPIRRRDGRDRRRGHAAKGPWHPSYPVPQSPADEMAIVTSEQLVTTIAR